MKFSKKLILMTDWSKNEYEAYRAHELASAGVDIGTILKNLGRYDQGVVDSAAAAKRKKNKKNKKR